MNKFLLTLVKIQPQLGFWTLNYPNKFYFGGGGAAVAWRLKNWDYERKVASLFTRVNKLQAFFLHV